MIEEAIEVLSKHVNVEKINDKRYIISNGLINLANQEVLPINIIEMGGAIYFADYGNMEESYNKKLKGKNLELLLKYLSKNGVTFEDDRFLMRTSIESVLLDLNLFVRALFMYELI